MRSTGSGRYSATTTPCGVRPEQIAGATLSSARVEPSVATGTAGAVALNHPRDPRLLCTPAHPHGELGSSRPSGRRQRHRGSAEPPADARPSTVPRANRAACAHGSSRQSGPRSPRPRTAGAGSSNDARIRSQVDDIVLRVAPGRLTTYGEIGGDLDVPARHVASILARSDRRGWHRLVSADGTLARRRREEQQRMLEAEGVEVRDGRAVDRQRLLVHVPLDVERRADPDTPLERRPRS